VEARRTVLYVDDEEPNLFLFQLTFRDEVEVLTAKSGEKALAILDAHKEIDSVISDMRMPGMSGLEFIQKAKEKHSEIPYFLLTGFDRTNEIETAVQQHVVSECFLKPFKKDEILRIIMN
jgi:two-component system response regulator (stage 0 sporulation protein F)